MDQEYSLANLATIRSHVGVKDDFTELDAKLVDYSMLATQMIETACRVSFMAEDRVEILDTPRNSNLVLDLYSQGMDGQNLNLRPMKVRLQGWPIAADATISVRYDPVRRVFGSDTELAADFYVFERKPGRLILNYAFEAAESALRVAYAAGYPVDFDPLPPLDPAYEVLAEQTDVTTTLDAGGGVDALFDDDAAKTQAQAASVLGNVGSITQTFDDAQRIAKVSWFAPTDTPVHPNAITVLKIEGSTIGDFSDAVEIASKRFAGVQGGDQLIISADTYATAHKAFRVTATGDTGQASTSCAQAEFLLKNPLRPVLRTVPKDLVLGCCMLTQYLFKKNQIGAVGMATAIERRGAAFRDPHAIPQEVKDIIYPYRRLLTK